jgi:putative FmdB family regulatory protein
MPIYAYRCAACGHAKDVLQKMSDPPLLDCPACGQPRLEKQITAAGFQLKGSGWYVTDFREGQKKADKAADKSAADKPGQGAEPAKPDAKPDAKPATAAPAPAASSATPAAAPAAPAPPPSSGTA